LAVTKEKGIFHFPSTLRDNKKVLFAKKQKKKVFAFNFGGEVDGGVTLKVMQFKR